MNRLNHVKIVSTDPAAVERFLRLVAELPAGWPLGDQASQATPPLAPALAGRALTSADVAALRGASSTNGYIAGDENSRQFQILRGDASRIWAIAIGTRDVTRAHRLCLENGFEASPVELTAWGRGQAVRFFFARAGGVMFELMSVEKTAG